MECVEGALKNSFGFGFGPSTHQQQFSDDFWAVNGVAGDDFFVDDLLDFSKDGGFVEENDSQPLRNDKDDENNNKPLCVSPLKTEHNDNSPTNFSIPDSELCLPSEDVADLEWVSHFVDDSFSGGYSLTCPAAGKSPEKKLEQQVETPVNVKPSFTTPVQTKARSKRTRTGGRVWSLGAPSLTESSTSCSSSSSCTSNPWLIYNDSSQTAESVFGKPPVKKQKKKKPAATGEAGTGQQQPRRCSHCLVQKTPQWRAGPLGAKTLCNACGVRYKSGRLLPEYRPACSPTFSSEVHSNNHRKVLEMRQKKEAAEAGLTPPVQSF